MSCGAARPSPTISSGIDASIIEVTLNDTLQYGLQWAFSGGTGGGGGFARGHDDAVGSSRTERDGRFPDGGRQAEDSGRAETVEEAPQVVFLCIALFCIGRRRHCGRELGLVQERDDQAETHWPNSCACLSASMVPPKVLCPR